MIRDFVNEEQFHAADKVKIGQVCLLHFLLRTLNKYALKYALFFINKKENG